MYDSVVTLIQRNPVISTDTGIVQELGPFIETEDGAQLVTADGSLVREASPMTTRIVYAQVDSISRSEWYEAGNAGFKPEYRFRMPRSSYNGELALDFGGVRYSIYRTYTEKGEVELYAQKATGETYGG